MSGNIARIPLIINLNTNISNYIISYLPTVLDGLINKSTILFTKQLYYEFKPFEILLIDKKKRPSIPNEKRGGY